MSDSEYAEPAPKRQKQDADAAPTPVLIMKSEADATAMAKAASRFIGVPPFPDTAKFESDRPHEVIAPAFDAPPGKITIFVNSEKAGQMSLSINTKPEGAESEEWHEMAMDQLGFHQDSGIAKFFFRDAKAPKDNKQAARLAAKAKKEGVAEADLAAWLHKQARSDQMSACAFTKKLAGIGDDDTRFFKCNYNCLVPNKSSTAQREPEFTEKQLNSMPYELMLKVRELIAAGHEFKASPFFNLEGKRVPLAEIFSKFSTSGGGTSTPPSPLAPPRPLPPRLTRPARPKSTPTLWGNQSSAVSRLAGRPERDPTIIIGSSPSRFSVAFSSSRAFPGTTSRRRRPTTASSPPACSPSPTLAPALLPSKTRSAVRSSRPHQAVRDRDRNRVRARVRARVQPKALPFAL